MDSNEGATGAPSSGFSDGRDHPPDSVAPSLVSIPGWASKDPNKLCPCIRALYLELHVKAKEQGLVLVTIETARDFARQRYYRSIGTSRILQSLHLPQPPNGLSLAFDVAPKDYLRFKGWLPSGPVWNALGRIGMDLGLEWGGTWKGFVDRPHFQLSSCRCSK